MFCYKKKHRPFLTGVFARRLKQFIELISFDELKKNTHEKSERAEKCISHDHHFRGLEKAFLETKSMPIYRMFSPLCPSLSLSHTHARLMCKLNVDRPKENIYLYHFFCSFLFSLIHSYVAPVHLTIRCVPPKSMEKKYSLRFLLLMFYILSIHTKRWSIWFWLSGEKKQKEQWKKMRRKQTLMNHRKSKRRRIIETHLNS